LKLDTAGNPLWQTAYNADGVSQSHGTGAIAQDPGSGRLLLAGNVIFQATNALNAWVLGLASDGTPGRSVVFPAVDPAGMTLADSFRDVRVPQRELGPGFVVVGDTEHFHHNPLPFADGWLLRFDTEAQLLWQWTITQSGVAHRCRSVTPLLPPPGDTLPSGYLLAGSVSLEGTQDARAWLLRVQEDGNPNWERIYDTSF